MDYQAKPNSLNHMVTSNSFGPINRAIEIEAAKRAELGRLYVSQRVMNWAKLAFYITLSIAAIVLTVALLYSWLFAKPEPTPVAVSASNNTSVPREIVVESASIDTTFTVFQRQQIETGEIVVTGKTFSPDNLSVPYEQYCYIEYAEATTDMAGENIAAIENGKLVMETQDPFLLSTALKACQFSQDKVAQ